MPGGLLACSYCTGSDGPLPSSLTTVLLVLPLIGIGAAVAGRVRRIDETKLFTGAIVLAVLLPLVAIGVGVKGGRGYQMTQMDRPPGDAPPGETRWNLRCDGIFHSTGEGSTDSSLACDRRTRGAQLLFVVLLVGATGAAGTAAVLAGIRPSGRRASAPEAPSAV